jgi:predicted DNA-binding transcriptional regulator AlpA
MSTHRATRLQSAITELVDGLGEDISARVVNSIAKKIASSPMAQPITGTQVPFKLRAIGAEEVGSLLGLAARTVLETVACRPDFPTRITMRPATWIAGEVLEWRRSNRRRT